MLKTSLTILFIAVSLHAFAYPVTQISGTVEQVIDRSIIINKDKFSPSGYASSLPKWVVPGSEVTISFSCNEIGTCYYVDIVEINGTLPLMDKINQELLDLERVFP